MSYPRGYEPTEAERRKDEAHARWMAAREPAAAREAWFAYQDAIAACEPDSFTRDPLGYWKAERVRAAKGAAA